MCGLRMDKCAVGGELNYTNRFISTKRRGYSPLHYIIVSGISPASAAFFSSASTCLPLVILTPASKRLVNKPLATSVARVASSAKHATLTALSTVESSSLTCLVSRLVSLSRINIMLANANSKANPMPTRKILTVLSTTRLLRRHWEKFNQRLASIDKESTLFFIRIPILVMSTQLLLEY